MEGESGEGGGVPAPPRQVRGGPGRGAAGGEEEEEAGGGGGGRLLRWRERGRAAGGGGVPVSPCLPPVPGLVWCESSHGGSARSHSRSAHSLLPDKGRFNKVEEEGTRLPAFKLSHPPSHPSLRGRGAAPDAVRGAAGGRGRPGPARLGSARPGPAGPSRGAGPGPGAERGASPHLSGRRPR